MPEIKSNVAESPEQTATTTEVETKPASTVAAAPIEVKGAERVFSRSVIMFFAVAVAALLAVVIFGVHSRILAASRLAQSTAQAAIPSVTVVHPQPETRAQDLILPGNTQAFIDSPIYARTNGYLKRWYVDIGARVHKGELLAEIETPELDQQLRQARADLATAQANLNLSQITAERDENLLKTHSVSTQERDNAVNGNAANKATVESNQANVARLEQLQSYEKVYAPFDGVITARSTDIGALIDAGANAPKELFHVAAVNKLRIYVAVPEVYSRAAVTGSHADLTLDEYPGELFQGTLVRNSNSIDAASRTLLVEVDVENNNGRLMPGAYAQVHLKLPSDAHFVTIPSNALIFRKDGLQVAVVRNGKAELVRVTPGHDFGDSMEVLAGLQAEDSVVLSPSDSLITGTPVQLSKPASGGAGE
jgi:RND family efflux transporter MFP subunit